MIATANRMDSMVWWKNLPLDTRIELCEKYYSTWKWYTVFHSNAMIERMWQKEMNA